MDMDHKAIAAPLDAQEMGVLLGDVLQQASPPLQAVVQPRVVS